MARMPQDELTERVEAGSSGAGLLLVTMGLMAVGVVMVHSALAGVGNQSAKWYSRVDFRQTLFAVLGVLAMLAAWRFDYRILARGNRLPILATIMLVFSLGLAMLVYVPGIGHAVGGYKRWIRFNAGGIQMQFQPSELVKIFLIIWLAAWLSSRGEKITSFFRTFIPACGIIGMCLGLVATQDFGTATIIGVSACAVMFIAGVPWYYFAALVPPAVGAFYVLVFNHPMRWARITAMTDIWSQSNPTAYQPRESLLAIVSGGWFGKGVGNGVIKLGYLPEDSTDFVFAIFCEEWGYIGAILLVGLFVAWLLLARRAANGSRDGFGRLLAGSLAFMIGFQAVIHIGVDVGALPATGLNLPFVSAGGTSVILLACAAALVASVARRTAKLRQAELQAKEDWKLREQLVQHELQVQKASEAASSVAGNGQLTIPAGETLKQTEPFEKIKPAVAALKVGIEKPVEKSVIAPAVPVAAQLPEELPPPKRIRKKDVSLDANDDLFKSDILADMEKADDSSEKLSLQGSAA